MIAHHPIVANDQSRLDQFGGKVLPDFPTIRIVRGEHLERRHHGRRL